MMKVTHSADVYDRESFFGLNFDVYCLSLSTTQAVGESLSAHWVETSAYQLFLLLVKTLPY